MCVSNIMISLLLLWLFLLLLFIMIIDILVYSHYIIIRAKLSKLKGFNRIIPYRTRFPKRQSEAERPILVDKLKLSIASGPAVVLLGPLEAWTVHDFSDVVLPMSCLGKSCSSCIDMRWCRKFDATDVQRAMTTNPCVRVINISQDLLDQIFHGASSSLAQDWTEAWTRGHPHITWQLPLFGTTATNSTASHHCAPIASLCISQIIQFDHTVILSSTFIQVPSHFFPHLQRSRARRKREFHALCHYQRPGERAGNSNGGPQTKLDTPAGFNSAHLCWSIAGKISAPGRGKLKLCVGPKSWKKYHWIWRCANIEGLGRLES